MFNGYIPKLVDETESPDVVFISCIGQINYNGSAFKIGYIPEDKNNYDQISKKISIKYFDLLIGSLPIIKSKKICKFPTYNINENVKDNKLNKLNKLKFCCFIENEKNTKSNLEIINVLSKIGNIEYFSKFKKELKLDYMSQFIFSMCQDLDNENEIRNIINAGCIPIYNEHFNDTINLNIFNQNRIIYYDSSNNKSIHDCYNKIVELMTDQKKLYDFYKQSPYITNYKNEFKSMIDNYQKNWNIKINHENNNYNIIPLGDHCSISMILKEIGIRSCSYPFDWITYSDQINSSNILYNCDILKKIISAYNIDDIVLDFIGDAYSTKKNKITTMWFPHEDDCKSEDELFQKYKRRFLRIKNDIINKKNIFIINTRKYHIKEENIINLLVYLKEFNKDNKILFISGEKHIFNDDSIYFKYIKYDKDKFYQYDYTNFRPSIKKFLLEFLL